EIQEETNPMIPQEKDTIKPLIFKSCNPETPKNSINLTNPLNAESLGPRHLPGYETESQLFRVQLRKNEFLNPIENRPFESLDGCNKLSEEMKSFSTIAQAQHINYINEKLNSKKPLINKPIPITADEEQVQLAESSMKKKELILVIESLIGSLNDTNRSQFKGLKSKKKDELLVILQQVRELTNNNEAD
ncbi:5081_t:CDS:2, partial [Cetraspora pellucida]